MNICYNCLNLQLSHPGGTWKEVVSWTEVAVAVAPWTEVAVAVAPSSSSEPTVLTNDGDTPTQYSDLDMQGLAALSFVEHFRSITVAFGPWVAYHHSRFY